MIEYEIGGLISTAFTNKKTTESETIMDKFNLESTLTFLSDIRKNNNKTWFDQNRQAYEAAHDAFESFTNALIDEFRISDDLQDLTAKDCISRIYRDIRFSKDKSPYKTHMWATIAPGGKKATRMGYHFAIQPQGESMIASGMWDPSTEQLTRFRQAIDQDASEFKRITSEKAFIDYFGGIEGEKLKTAPQGYDRSHPDIELLQYKQILVAHNFTDQQVLADDFLEQVVLCCQAMRPFVDYLNGIL
jgi:uncharacterized protein (TIGR02453 family)